MSGEITPEWVEFTAELYGIRDIEHFMRQLVLLRKHRKASSHA